MCDFYAGWGWDFLTRNIDIQNKILKKLQYEKEHYCESKRLLNRCVFSKLLKVLRDILYTSIFVLLIVEYIACDMSDYVLNLLIRLN